MRWVAGLALLVTPVMGCSSCRRTEQPALNRADAAAPDAAASAAPAPLIFTDAGDAASLKLANGQTLVIAPAGPALLSLELTGTAKALGKTLNVERHLVGGDAAKELDSFAMDPKHRFVKTVRHVAEPGKRYAYRAKIDEAEWTPEVIVRLALPTSSPGPVTNLVAKTDTPYAVALAWDADPRAVIGFAIDVLEDGEEWSLVGISNSSENRFTHNYRLPKTKARYRVTAFNANGKSAPVETAETVTPAKNIESDLQPPTKKPLPRCLPHQPNTRDTDWEKEDGHGVGTEAAAPGTELGLRRITGWYKGCFRDMAVVEVQGDLMRSRNYHDESGYPILRAITGAGQYAGASVEMYGLKNGRYESVNTAYFCGESYPEDSRDHRPTFEVSTGKDPTKWRGPFQDCQRDTFDIEERP